MRRFLLPSLLFLIASVDRCLAEDIADVIAARDLSNFADGDVVAIRLAPNGHHLPWSITFRHDGSVHAQYGALAGDGASQPKNSVDFGALLQAVERLKYDKRQAEMSWIVLHRKGQTTATSFSLRDDTLFRYFIASFEKTWKPDLYGLKRFDQLLESHPFYDDEETRTKSTQKFRPED